MHPIFRVLAFACTLSLLAQSPAPLPSSIPTTLVNGAFADGPLGQMPKGWFLPKSCRDAGFRCETAEDPGLPGKRCAVVFREGTRTRDFGNLMQSVDATSYRGKRIRLSGSIRLEFKEGPGPMAQMWLRVDRVGKKMGFFDNMNDRPVVASAWMPVEIIGDVAADAEQLALGVMLPYGGEKLWIAPMTLEVLGETPVVRAEGSKPLTTQGRRNLEAFTRALNYIRFFHPSDEAARADWNRLASEGVRAVEGATSVVDLVEHLQRFFAPYAPTAQFLAQGKQPKIPTTPPNASFVVRWNHLGFGQANSRSGYKSIREFAPLAERAARGWVDPHATAPLGLTAGVNMWLPSVLFADASKGTLPKVTVLHLSTQVSELPQPTAGGSGSGEDRATRLGDVALAWGIFQHFYPYFDVVQTDWNSELSNALRAAALDQGAESFLHTLRRMVAALKDGHGRVDGAGSRASSVPSLDLVMVDGQPVVRYAGASAKAVPAGSQILSVDGEPSQTRTAHLKTEISSAGEGWMNSRLTQEFLEGDAGTKVLVRYRSASGLEGGATLPRDATVREQRVALKPERLTELKPGVWYVDLDRVSDQDFQEALPKLAQAKGVIFDLRGYPKMSPTFLQHLADFPLESARWNKPIVTQPDGNAWGWDTSGRWDLEPKVPRITGKRVFLTGGGAISRAESYLGIVEAYKLAEIVGEPSAGTNGNVNPFTLPGGYSVHWTGMKVLKQDGTTHHGVGIQPTVMVRPTQQGLAEGRDEVLEKAIEIVSH